MKFNAKRHFRAARWRLERGFRQFIVRNTYSAAPEEVLEEKSVVLNDKQWKAFMRALDAPPRSHARMKRLLNEPSILDE